MDLRMQHCFVLLFIVVVAMEAMAVMGEGHNNDGESDCELLGPKKGTKQEQVRCKGKGACFYMTLTCPAECPDRKPKDKKKKACFTNCGNKCEATCKRRKLNCEGYGAVCYDPRFVGGDGSMFYFHGAKGGDFALVSDKNLHINTSLEHGHWEGLVTTHGYKPSQSCSILSLWTLRLTRYQNGTTKSIISI